VRWCDTFAATGAGTLKGKRRLRTSPNAGRRCGARADPRVGQHSQRSVERRSSLVASRIRAATARERQHSRLALPGGAPAAVAT
jgi:hypothetical protein